MGAATRKGRGVVLTRRAERRYRIARNKLRRYIFRVFSRQKLRRAGLPWSMGQVDKAGNPISYRMHMWLFEDDRYRVVKQTTVDPVFVSTIWIGQDEDAVFETMTRVDDEWTSQNRYRTERDAVTDHDKLVDALSALDPFTRSRAQP